MADRRRLLATAFGTVLIASACSGAGDADTTTTRPPVSTIAIGDDTAFCWSERRTINAGDPPWRLNTPPGIVITTVESIDADSVTISMSGVLDTPPLTMHVGEFAAGPGYAAARLIEFTDTGFVLTVGLACEPS